MINIVQTLQLMEARMRKTNLLVVQLTKSLDKLFPKEWGQSQTEA